MRSGAGAIIVIADGRQKLMHVLKATARPRYHALSRTSLVSGFFVGELTYLRKTGQHSPASNVSDMGGYLIDSKEEAEERASRPWVLHLELQACSSALTVAGDEQAPQRSPKPLTTTPIFYRRNKHHANPDGILRAPFPFCY